MASKSVANTVRAFGIDVSRHDGLIDWSRVLSHPEQIVFMAFRCTVSWGYRDPFFVANYRDAYNYGIARMAYHVVYPSESAIRQADNLFGHLGTMFLSTDRLVLDVELEDGIHNVSVSKYTQTIRAMADIILSRTGNLPILYSRAEFLNRRVDMLQLQDLDLWLAQYLKKPQNAEYAQEHPGPPDLPRHTKNWLIHQTGHETPNICATSGKKYQDYNRWNGTTEDVLRYFGLKKVATIEERVASLESRVAALEQKIA